MKNFIFKKEGTELQIFVEMEIKNKNWLMEDSYHPPIAYFYCRNELEPSFCC
jgi:hypothetical protein